MITIKTRDGFTKTSTGLQDKVLVFIYGSALSRFLLKPFVQPWFSQLGGWFMDTRFSCILIRPFIRRTGIDMTQYEAVRYRNFNEFFCRKIKDGERTVDADAAHLIAPCDSKLKVIALTGDSVLHIKHTAYPLRELLMNDSLCDRYGDGTAMIFRLSVDDYHRYCYVDDGTKTDNTIISGVLHTVNPIANEYYPIYKENSRAYSVLHSKNFGDVLMMEVGALLVGKIINRHDRAEVKRGEEKGHFEYGGSTVVLLFEKDRVLGDEDILKNSADGIETIVKMGECIGTKK